MTALRAGALLCTLLPSIVGAQTAGAGIRKLNIEAPSAAVTAALEMRDRPAWHSEASDRIPFVVSASGGISLGSYQAGVTWSLGRFMRLLYDDASYRARVHVGRPDLAAATGASAGNVNAVLSAVEWCTPAALTPEQSLFWRVWVNVGWPELFPSRDAVNREKGKPGYLEPDPAVFDRQYFSRYLFPEITRRMKDEMRPECDGFPIGVTATRVDPALFPVTDRLTAKTQRFAATFLLTRRPGGTGLEFSQAPDNLRDRGIGATMALSVGRQSTIPDSMLFKLIEASSSFPIAFSPRELSYYFEPLGPARVCPPIWPGSLVCKEPDRAWFTDGGVFDNNPLRLALDIYARRSDSVRLVARANTLEEQTITTFPSVPSRGFYVGTDAFRGTLDSTRRNYTNPGPIGGLNAIVRLVQGAVPSARQYEMQTLARAFATDPNMKSKYIKVTTRYFPVFGEHLGAFGAFLGRPFREWDYYAGVYDGMVFAARDIICADEGKDVWQIAHGTYDACVKHFAAELVSGKAPVVLDSVGPHVLADMFAEEFSVDRNAPDFRPPGLSDRDFERLTVLRALTRAQIDQAKRTTQPVCNFTDWAENILCPQYLNDLLYAVRESSVKQLERWVDTPPCSDNTQTLDNPCLADAGFVQLVQHPAAEVKGRVGQISQRLWEVERRIKEISDSTIAAAPKGTTPPVAPEFSKYLKMAEFLLRSSDWPARMGQDFEPSSIPPQAPWNGKRFVASVLPYHAAMSVGIGGFDIGYDLLHHPNDYYAWHLNLGLVGMNQLFEGADTTRAIYFKPGAGFLIKRGGFKWPAWGLAFRPTVSALRWDHGVKPSKPQSFWTMSSLEGTGLFIGGKIRVTMFTMPHALHFAGGDRPNCRLPVVNKEFRCPGLTVGIADVPGISYWLMK